MKQALIDLLLCLALLVLICSACIERNPEYETSVLPSDTMMPMDGKETPSAYKPTGSILGALQAAKDWT